MIESTFRILKNSFQRKTSLRLCLLSSLISYRNIKSFTFKNIRCSWCLSSKNSLFYFLILWRCNVVFLKFSFFFNCRTRKVKRSSILWILLQFIICQMKYSISMNNITSHSYNNRKKVMSIEFWIVIRSIHDIACKCWDHILIFFIC